MRARAYVSVQGESFNAGDFQLRAGGRVRRKKHSGAPFANHPLEDWASVETPIGPYGIDASLSNLLTELTPVLAGVAKTRGISILAHVVLEFDQGEEPIGLYLSEETIHILNELGAALDVDAVRLLPSHA